MPLWIQYSQALAAPAIALLAIVIAILQWRTAHQKVVLDLFERRMKVYSEIRAVIASIVSSGKLPNENHFEFMLARSEEHTSELQSHLNLVCRLLLEKKKK